MAAIIKTNGQVDQCEPADGKEFTLEETQKIVGGYVSVLQIRGPLKSLGLEEKELIMIVNEEGLMNNLPPNELATMIYRKEFLVGDVLLCTPNQFT